jgi:TetR/AcrR family transcriptional regulator, cholesterol catabolism regulator
MDDIELRILKAAIALATKGGFENVRQRDLAEQAQVALGTLYARFSSKDLVLVSAMAFETQKFEKDLKADPIIGATPEARIVEFFERLNTWFVARPHLARAILRAAASGDKACIERLMEHNTRVTALGAGVLRGRSEPPTYDANAAVEVVTLLTMIWFANLVGWSAGVMPPEMVMAVMKRAVTVTLRGVVAA